jgi:hypothetical protein
VKIQFVLDRNADRLFSHDEAFSGQRAGFQL